MLVKLRKDQTHFSPTLGRVENPELINLGGAETFLPSPPGQVPLGADTFRPTPAPGAPPPVGAEIIRVQEWDRQPCAERVTLSVIGWRNPIPDLNPPHSRILWKIGSRISRISSARTHETSQCLTYSWSQDPLCS